MYDYTLAQVQVFSRAIEKAEKQRRVDALLDMRASQVIDGKTFADYLKKIQ